MAVVKLEDGRRVKISDKACVGLHMIAQLLRLSLAEAFEFCQNVAEVAKGESQEDGPEEKKK